MLRRFSPPKPHITRYRKVVRLFIHIQRSKASLCRRSRLTLDPVVLFKMILLQYLFGIRSMRQTCKEIEVNAAYRWFLGYDLLEPTPHFSTFGKNYVRRFANTDIFEKIFEQILNEAVDCGFVDTSAVFIDATHIKANANNKKSTNELVTIEAKLYQKELTEVINKDRIAHDKKLLKDKDNKDNDYKDKDNNESTKNIKQSTTDPESGLFHSGRIAATPYKRPMTKKGFFKKYEYAYDE